MKLKWTRIIRHHEAMREMAKWFNETFEIFLIWTASASGVVQM